MIFPFKKKVVIIVAIIATVIIALTLGLYFGLASSNDENPISPAIPRYRGAVVSNGLECADIGRNILQKNGSVADAAIATLFCEGITNPQSMGLGGGFLATIYIKSTGMADSLVARESAPLASDENMFANTSIEGGLAVAVPAEIKGYSALHEKYGKLPWSDLIEPTIKLCEEGHTVSSYLATKLKEKEAGILKVPGLKELFIDPKTGQSYKAGDKIKRIKLAETLKIIARDGEDAIYNGGSIGKLLVQDIQSYGGIITQEDLKQYKVRWVEPVKSYLQDYTVLSMPLPGSGPVLSLILNLVQSHITNDKELLWHRVIEAFKHGFGQRTQLGDIDFLPDIAELVSRMPTQEFADEIYKLVKDNETFTNYDYYGANFSSSEDYGTANIAVLGANGDSITVTSTINMIFGAMLVSTNTGIILNNEMDDFSVPGVTNGFGLPASPANFIQPKKIPLSSMCPTIVLDKMKNPRLLIGGAGGSKITTSVAQAIIRHLLLNESLNDAVQEKRIHHQLSPMTVQHEVGYDPKILESLQKRGHSLQSIPPENGFSAVTAVAVVDSVPTAVFDSRRPGSFSLYND